MIARMKTAMASAGQRSRNRRDYNRLMGWSDKDLMDIGVTRDEVRHAARAEQGSFRSFFAI